MFKYGFIMAGGQGKRLRPLTAAIPKPLLPVGDKPIIQLIIEHMKDFGIVDIFVSVNYKKEIVKSFLRDGSRYGVNITYIEELERTGTAGSLALLPDGFDDKIIVSNGDLICDVDYSVMNDLLRQYDLVLTGIERKVPVDFGVLKMNGSPELRLGREAKAQIHNQRWNLRHLSKSDNLYKREHTKASVHRYALSLENDERQRNETGSSRTQRKLARCRKNGRLYGTDRKRRGF